MIPFDELKKLADTSGLSAVQVAEFRAKYGANAMTPPVRESLWKRYLEKFDDPVIRILLFAVGISTIVALVKGSGLLDTVGIIIAVLLATGIAFINEYRSSKEFDVLNAHRDDVGVRVIRKRTDRPGGRPGPRFCGAPNSGGRIQLTVEIPAP